VSFLRRESRQKDGDGPPMTIAITTIDMLSLGPADSLILLFFVVVKRM
jgi:hypothetical protein